ncbi:MFS transporter [Aestuariimicrobium kwangyangense]|uniref:MFS transporter n=1 Tax=Aestuariimicrobium kwangyangense TaxID=396389 RepID=UPI0003B4FF7E|nr:MFS transporter [Aestuariimicrobium kwangyangense]
MTTAVPTLPLFRRGALGEPGFARYLTAMLQGATGYWIARIAQDWLLLKLTGDVTAVGTAAALQFGPILLFGLWGGVLADKFNVRGLIAGAQLMQAAGAFAVGTLALLHLVEPWHIYAAATITGLSAVVEQPARSSMIVQLSGRHIAQGLSMNSIAFQAAGFWSPPMSAAMVAAIGPGFAFWMNGLGCCITAVLLFRAPTADPGPREDERITLREGLRTMRETTEIGWTMVLLASVSLLALAMPLVFAGMANEVFHSGIPGYSVFNSVMAAGCIVGSLLAGRTRGKARLRHLVGLLWISACFLAIGAVAPSPLLYAAVIVVHSVTITCFQLLSNALVQMSVDPSARGRVMGLYLLIAFGGMSLSQPLVGLLVDGVGPRLAQLVLAGLLAVGTVLSSLAIGRFTGQTVRVSRRGLRIQDPEVPRFVRMALRDASVAVERAGQTVERAERAPLRPLPKVTDHEPPA